MPKAKPSYLDRIDELKKVDVIRLKGVMDRSVIPLIEERIQLNRKAGSTIDKNVLIDYALVEDVDTATVAFHLVRLKEYEAKGFKIGFLNPSRKLRHLLDMFKQDEAFQIYATEADALRELN
ncbi:MAG: STAS domain-containing protein [Candidatus Omnitrophica bacterium]|nr:STAS domain-containing protein [Candidatus Omnitrophota bacterium]